ncbi:hypothetical protein [Clostridium hydrogeniformans]|uniref:hypothetical protein n=1 Tax=Clostridium hydrogeniformans TaxID=349933 RepID=UPI000AE1A7DD|nr:hypothetical protein [Clostridium hydrogeniformans]
MIIVQRLSTVRNADKILVLDEGKIYEEVTHEELINNNGIYLWLSTKKHLLV